MIQLLTVQDYDIRFLLKAACIIVLAVTIVQFRGEKKFTDYL